MADKRISQLVERTDIANNDVVPIVASGATTTNKATISSIQEFMQENLDLGVTSVGVTISQTDGQPISVTGSPITTSGNITINLPRATDSIRGLLDSEDFINFSNKQPAGNYVTLDTDQTITGAKTFSQDIFVNGRRIGRGSGNITSNTVVGNSALRDNTTGSENSAFGGNSLRQITTGAANTAIGFGSMINSETGSGNTAIGNSTLSGNNGSNNIAVGISAGRYIAGGTVVNETCLNSVYLGANTRPSLDGNTNEIVIGQNAIGQGSNTVTIGNSSTTLNKLFGRLIHADAVNADESATLGQVNTSLAGYVTLDTAQNITAPKGFINSGGGTCVTLNHTSGSGVALDIIKAGNNEAIRVNKTSGSGNAMTITGGNFEAPTIVRTGGTSSQFLMADGSVNTSVLPSGDYVTLATSQSITGLKTFTNSIILKNSPSLDGFILQSFSPNALEFGATISGTTYYSSIVFPAGAQSWNLPNASGTIALTSNLSAYLPLTGGTLTGALNGTTASFSSTIASPLHVETSGADGGIQIYRNVNADGGSAALFMSHKSTAGVINTANIEVVGSGSMLFRTGAVGLGNFGTTRLSISSTGAATFSSSVTATSPGNSSNSIVGNYSGGSQMMQFFQKPDGSNMELNLRNSSGTAIARIDTSGNSWFNGGNVGIGTASPANPSGFAKVLNVSGTDAALVISNTNGTPKNYTIGVIEAGKLLFLDGTSTRMAIDSTGNVGIGTASPLARLDVSSGALTGALIVGGDFNTTTGARTNATRKYAVLGVPHYTNAEEPMTFAVLNSGASDSEILIGGGQSNLNAATSIEFYTAANNTTVTGTERMRITSGGDVLIGTANNSPSAGHGLKNYADGRIYCVSSATSNASESYGMYSTGASNYRFYVGWGGTIFATNPIISSISDIRVKENIRDLDAGLDKIMALKPRVFDWKEGKGKDIKNDRGFIAQEFQEVFPDLIDEYKQEIEEGEEPYKSVRADLIPVLVKAIQELKTEIDSLKNQIK